MVRRGPVLHEIWPGTTTILLLAQRRLKKNLKVQCLCNSGFEMAKCSAQSTAGTRLEWCAQAPPAST